MSDDDGLRVYDSLEGDVVPFEPDDPDHVRMYVCGQTVYDNMHIGHGRTYIAFDIIRRYLEYRGYGVEVVINITDVNDKINDRADEEGRTPRAVADEYGRINLEDFAELGIEADAFPRASDYVAEMQEMVQQLIDQGYAYESGGNVFFDVRSFDDYGKLSNQQLEAISGDRDDIQGLEDKRSEEDFVLWRSRDPDATSGPTWDSPWGEGVPGWHIECSAMATSLLGEQFDIHGGGADLTFPHHEDEIAQAEACTGEQPWVRYWMHTGLVRLQDEKMSKSIGNFVPTRELLEDHDPRAIRLMVAGTQYRKPFDYSQDRIEQAESRLEKYDRALRNLQEKIKEYENGEKGKDIVPRKPSIDLDRPGFENDKEVLETLFDRRRTFIKHMNDDFNTSPALKALFGIVKDARKYLRYEEQMESDLSLPLLKRLHQTLMELGEVIGITQDSVGRDYSTDSVEPASDRTVFFPENSTEKRIYQWLVEYREILRNNGEYEKADVIRDALKEIGVKIEDTGSGPRWYYE